VTRSTPRKERPESQRPDLEESLWGWTPQSEQNVPRIGVIDLFCGCGGFSLGVDIVGRTLGGIATELAWDMNSVAIETIRRNLTADAQVGDVRDLPPTFWEKARRKKEARESIWLIGCPPCQGFSAHRKKHKGEEDERNSLVYNFADIAVELSPDVVIMENVPELVTGKHTRHFNSFQERVEGAGYRVKWEIYNAADFGVPQKRRRAIVIAMKRDFCMPEAPLEKKAWCTVRDAFQRIAANKEDRLGAPTRHKESTIRIIQSVPKNGGSRPHGIGPKCLDRVNGFGDVYGRLKWEEPAITITKNSRNPASGRFSHPEEDRGLTAREAATLQTFPQAYDFAGRSQEIFDQIGEAVPPLFAAGIIYDLIKKSI
jgi:DNA (cytosine-5)-methyltransferase 1